MPSENTSLPPPATVARPRCRGTGGAAARLSSPSPSTKRAHTHFAAAQGNQAHGPPVRDLTLKAAI